MGVSSMWVPKEMMIFCWSQHKDGQSCGIENKADLKGGRRPRRFIKIC